jgi:mono/diheme cytochrome c family protein
MREIIARGVCVFTMLVVIGLSVLFASEHNPPVPSIVGPAALSAPPSVAVAPGETIGEAVGQSKLATAGALTADAERGRAVYAAHKCATCHSIADEGNPRNALDGVASRWDAAELRDWITGTGVAAEVLSQAVVKRKRRYQSIPEQDLNALVVYLSGLVGEDQPTAKDGGKELTP